MKPEDLPISTALIEAIRQGHGTDDYAVALAAAIARLEADVVDLRAEVAALRAERT